MTTTLRTTVVALALAFATAVQATDFTQIFKDSIFGASPNNTTTYWLYVANATETLTMVAQQTKTSTGIPRPFSDDAFENAISISPGYVNGIYQYKLKVEAGEIYYFKLVATWADSAYYILQSEGGGAVASMALTSTNPTEGTTLDISGSGTVVAYFNQAFTCNGTATMKCGNMTNDTLGVNIISSTCSAQVEYKEALMDWLSNGRVQEGDTVTFTYTNIASSAYPDSLLNGDGTLTLSYLVPAKPVQLIEQAVPETFLSYWLSDDEDGIFRLTFDGELSSASAYLTYGERDTDGEYYYESLSVQIDSNEIVIDLTNKLRNAATLVSSGTIYESVYIKVSSVRDINGNSPYSSDQGSVGSYSFNIPYSDISTNFATEWLPKDGKDISEKTNCELYISKTGVVVFDSFAFTYQSIDADAAAIVDATASVDLSDVKIEDEDGGIVYTFAFPEEVKAGYNVTLTLDGLSYVDGIDTTARTAMLTVTYNPATDEELEALLQATGIQTLSAATTGTHEGIYTLSGQKVTTDMDALPAGIYIVDGQKVLVK